MGLVILLMYILFNECRNHICPEYLQQPSFHSTFIEFLYLSSLYYESQRTSVSTILSVVPTTHKHTPIYTPTPICLRKVERRKKESSVSILRT